MSNDRSVLVIGGGGYIGRHLVHELVSVGRKVSVLGRRKAIPNYHFPNGVAYIAGDFSQSDLLGPLLDSHQEVVHLAYSTVPNTSFVNPLADLTENLPPTMQLFSEIARRGNKLLLVSSGGTVYGEAINLPIREDHPTKPISPYGVTKLTLENYAHLYAVTHNMKYVCVRPANPYGVGQKPFLGQGFISTAIASAIQGKPIQVYGETGTIRDYIYVTDLAAGIVSALERGQLSETYNLGSGKGLTNLDVLKVISFLTGKYGHKISIKHLAERAFDVKANVLDSAKLEEHTGWKSQVDFSIGLEKTYAWLIDIYG